MVAGIRSVVRYLLVAVNVLMVAGMCACAYSCRLNSHDYPECSYWGMLFPFFLCAVIFFMVLWLLLKRRYVLIGIAGMVVCADAIRTFCPVNFHASVPDDAIKVLSYNVMGFGDHKGIEWKDNEVAQYIINSGADIVCLQEGNNVDLRTLHQLFDSVYPYMAIDTIRISLNLITLSKTPIISGERIKYESKTNGSFAHKVVRNDDTICVINNHFESYKLKNKDKDDYKTIIRNIEKDIRTLERAEREGDEERYDSLINKIKAANYIRACQADSVAKYIENSDAKYIICMGDFNAPSLSYTHYRLTRSLNDAYTRSGNGVGFSYNSSGMYFRIDNILVSENIKAYGARVDDFSKMSDHYPIYAWLRLKGSDSAKSK